MGVLCSTAALYAGLMLVVCCTVLLSAGLALGACTCTNGGIEPLQPRSMLPPTAAPPWSTVL